MNKNDCLHLHFQIARVAISSARFDHVSFPNNRSKTLSLIFSRCEDSWPL